MRPVNLYIRNFKSYGENTPVLDFDAFDILLLTGENGNGKSSLADAIAWCVWGQCKGMSGRGGIDDLIRVGAQDMEVSFIFEEEDNYYKIIRKRDKKRSLSALDLYIRKGDKYVSISGNRIDETQSKIEEIIKLDYDTYLCTAYLSQGKADLFATKKPNERKEILAEILNLSIYEKLERLASEKRSELQSKITILERELENLEAQASDKDKVKNELAVIETDIKSMQHKEDELGNVLADLNKQREEKESISKKVESYREDLKRTLTELKKFDSERQMLKNRIQEYKNLLGREALIKKDYEMLTALQEENKLLNEKRQKTTELMRGRDAIVSKIQAAEREISHEIELIQREIQLESRKLNDLENLAREKEKIQKSILHLDSMADSVKQFQDETAQIIEKIGQLRGGEKSLKIQLDELKDKFSVLKDSSAACPLCKRPLLLHQKDELINELIEKGKDIQKALKKTGEDIKEEESKLFEVKGKISKLNGQINGRGRFESQLALLNRQIEEGRAAQEEIDKLNNAIKPLKQKLDTGSYKNPFSKDYKKIEKDIKLLEYDESHHRDVVKDIKNLQHASAAWEELRVAIARLESDGESMARLEGVIKDKNNYMDSLNMLIEDLMKSTQDLEEIKKKIALYEKNLTALGSDIRSLEGKRGALNEKIRQIENAEKEIGIKNKERESLLHRLEIYKALVNIYSKRGIQAAIIENAIPELQDETNRILAKITDGQFMVEFLTQRDTTTGNVIETLDIKISDGLDTRKYETYSGGEEFRINFAIRIALAKTLANRAGANLKMLILDEGFGVLDEKGRERLAQIINGIRDEFEKIIVITHIQDLKEYFPTQLEVYMTPQGSMFKMVG